MYIFDSIMLACSMAYFGITLVLGLTVATRLFNNNKTIYPFQRLGGIAILIDSFCTLLPFLLMLLFGWQDDKLNYYYSVARGIDGLVVLLIVMMGISLMSGRYPSFKAWFRFGLPYVIVFIFQIFFSRGHYIIASSIILIISLTLIAYLSRILIPQSQRLNEMYSNLEEYGTKWYRNFVYVLAAEIVVWYIVLIVAPGYGWWNIAYMLIMVVLWMTYAHYLTKQKAAAMFPESTSEESSQSAFYSVPACSEPAAVKEQESELCIALKKKMNEEQLFLNPDLDLFMLADALNSNVTYVSRVLHDEIGMSFYDYVNGLRVAHARALLFETSDKVETISANSGFNSSRTFFRVFKAVEGCTPTEWRTRMS